MEQSEEMKTRLKDCKNHYCHVKQQIYILFFNLYQNTVI